MFQPAEEKNSIFKYSFLFVGIAFIVGVMWWFISLMNAFDIGSGGTDYEKINSSISPNETYIANSYLATGGGAAGWCYQIVKIKNQSETQADDTEVFRTRCSSKIEVKWETEKNLNINYSDELIFEPETEWEEVKISYSLIAAAD